jgi:hypothetical protein
MGVMYRLLIKSLCVNILVFSFVSCGFVDLRPITLTTIPEQPYEVLPYANSPVVLRFDTEMQEKETEGVMQILSPSGSVEGDFVWKGRELHFIPASSWSKGIRYVLKISGNVYSKDGRDTFISKELPFYAMAVVPLPYLVSSDPVDGASTEAFVPGEVMLRLRFSLPMDTQSVEASLNCDGIEQKYIDIDSGQYFEWSDDDRVLSIRPTDPLSAWTIYRWSVSDKALSRDGAPLAKAVSGRFITNNDVVFPQVTKVVPLIRGDMNISPWGSWICNDIGLDNGLGPGQAIGVEFTKAMDTEKLKSSFSFEPSLPGRVEIISPYNAVYIPDTQVEPETQYTLRISGDIKDTHGLKMGEDHIVSFKSDVHFLRIISLSFYDKSDLIAEFSEPDRAKVFHVHVEEAENGVMRFAIRFSLPLSTEAKMEITSRIILSPFFPGSLGLVNLRFVSWHGNDRLYMEWEGLKCGKPGEPHYYKLVIPEGRSGINNGEGSYLKEETYFYIEAVKK